MNRKFEKKRKLTKKQKILKTYLSYEKSRKGWKKTEKFEEKNCEIVKKMVTKCCMINLILINIIASYIFGGGGVCTCEKWYPVMLIKIDNIRFPFCIDRAVIRYMTGGSILPPNPPPPDTIFYFIHTLWPNAWQGAQKICYGVNLINFALCVVNPHAAW